MSSQYNGDGTIPVATAPWTRKAIVSTTNASPIVVNLPTHGFNNGDTIEILGHQVNTNANGVHTITKIDANNFSLNGTTGNGAGSGTGYAVDYSVNPLITIPGDGDLASASSVNPAFEGLFNLAPYNYKRAGQYSLVDVFQADQTAAAPNVRLSGFPVNVPSTTTGGVWRDFPTLTALLSFGVPPALSGADGDFLEYDFSFSPRWIVTSPDVYDIAYAVSFETNGGAYSEQIATSYFVQDESGTALNFTSPLNFHGTVNGNANSWNFGVRYWFPTTLTNTAVLDLFNAWNLTVKHYRSNR